MADHIDSSRQDRWVVGLAGRIGSGKTAVGKHLNSARGFQYLRYSQVLAEWLAHNAPNRSILQKVGWEVMHGGMQAELNRRLISRINPTGDVAVDGLRHPVDYDSLKTSFLPSFRLLYIDGTPAGRWKHLEGSGKYESWAVFQEADSHPVEQQIELLRDKADFVISSDGPMEDLIKRVDALILGIKKKGKK